MHVHLLSGVSVLSLSVIIPALVGALAALAAKSSIEHRISRAADTRIFHSRFANWIRHFRESIAVLDAITVLRRDAFPIDAHITKLEVSLDLPPLNLNRKHQASFARTRLLLEDFSKDLKSINASKAANNADAYYVQIDEISQKMRNMVASWTSEFPHLRAQSVKPKEILFEDGQKLRGAAFDV